MKKFKYNADKLSTDKSGFIKKRKFIKSGIINCSYIPGILRFKSVYTQIDLKGPIFVYKNCKILKKFGPIKKGECYDTVLLDYNLDCIHMEFVKNNSKAVYLAFSEIES